MDSLCCVEIPFPVPHESPSALSRLCSHSSLAAHSAVPLLDLLGCSEGTLSECGIFFFFFLQDLTIYHPKGKSSH